MNSWTTWCSWWTSSLYNGIRHTASGQGGKIHIALWAGRGVLRAEVSDEGRAGRGPSCARRTGRAGAACTSSTRSRPLGHRADGPGTLVWADFPARVPYA